MKDIEQQIREINDPDASDMDASTEANLARLRKIRTATDELTLREVAFARDLGRSWQQIGDALGMSKQAAHERFS